MMKLGNMSLDVTTEEELAVGAALGLKGRPDRDVLKDWLLDSARAALGAQVVVYRATERERAVDAAREKVAEAQMELDALLATETGEKEEEGQ
jgi:hypothetical protein